MSYQRPGHNHPAVGFCLVIACPRAAWDKAVIEERERLTVNEHWRLVRCSINLLDTWGTRTERGERISVEWGEPDRDGIYEPVFTVHSEPS